MKITLKTLQGKQLPMEVEGDVTIEDFKQKIQEAHDTLPADQQQLVAYGKVLSDHAKTLLEYSIKDGDFIVVMIKKKVVAKIKPKPVEEEVPKPVEQPAAQQQPAAQVQQPPVQQPVAAQQQPVAAQPAPVQVDEETLGTLMAISGKGRDICSQALAAAFGDPDRAFQYLTDGIPQQQMPANAMQPVGGEHEHEAEGDDYGSEDIQGEGNQDFAAILEMAQNPNFAQLRARIMQNPAFYQEFMTMLQTQQPRLFAAIQANPQAFMNLILGGNPGAGMPAGGQPAAGGMPAGGQGQPGAGGAGAPRPGQLVVSQEEMQAIQNLQGLGFSQHRAAQAYFACDKNEELAANFLFEQAADDDDDALNQGVAQSVGVAAQPEQPVAAEAQPEQPEGAVQQPPAENQPDNNNNNGGENNDQPGGDNNDQPGDAGAGGDKSAFDQ